MWGSIGKPMKIQSLIAVAGATLLAFVVLTSLESLYRDQIFVQSLKADLLIQTNAGRYIERLDQVGTGFEDYFVFGALSGKCDSKYFACFRWDDYPNVQSVVTNSSELGDIAGYRVFRSCESADCRAVGGDEVLARPLTQPELSHAMGALESEETCWEPTFDEFTASLPIRYRVEYCIRESRLHGKLVSFNASAMVAHPHTMALLPSIWFSEELTFSVNYARSEVQSLGFEYGGKTLAVR